MFPVSAEPLVAIAAVQHKVDTLRVNIQISTKCASGSMIPSFGCSLGGLVAATIVAFADLFL